MGRHQSTDFFKPFEQLSTLLTEAFVIMCNEKQAASHSTPQITTDFPEDDDGLFNLAMADVKPAIWNELYNAGVEKNISSTHPTNESEGDVVEELKALINSGTGFKISNTPEYIEGIGYNVPPDITKRLHSGEFSVQAHLDLHGYQVIEAHEAFDRFLFNATRQGLRTILIIHGRGLSSKAEPVLKGSVIKWLTQNRWRKWVMAFTSARACDGGTGATYILLRQQPLTKRQRKKRSKNLSRR